MNETHVATLHIPFAFYNVKTSQKIRRIIEKYSKIISEFSGTFVETMDSHMSFEVSSSEDGISSMIQEVSLEFGEFLSGENWSFLVSAR